MTIAIGCTGGKHRSVAMSEKLAARLAAEGVETVACTGTWARRGPDVLCG